MACKSWRWNDTPWDDDHGYYCAASAGDHIAVSVHNHEGKSGVYFIAYLDMYEPSEGTWVQMGYRSGTSTVSGKHVSFNPNISTSRTFRVRIDLQPANGGFWVTTASFNHAG